MRTPKYLSPTALARHEESPTDYYVEYLADTKPDKTPQTQPMSVGSAFDAKVKSYLYDSLVGDKNPKFSFEALFEAQVETHNREWAREAGHWAFEQYKFSGALADLMVAMKSGIGKPSFEFEVLGAINGHKEGITIDVEVPIFGKPDVRFITSDGAHVTYDWKVNGFCGKSNTSPAPSYLWVRDGWGPDMAKASRGNNSRHKDCLTKIVNGITVSTQLIQDIDAKWADQLTTYGWLLGEPIGGEFIIGVDQLACQHSGVDSKPLIRVAQHRFTTSEEYQFQLLARYQKLWHKIHSGHFFDDLSLEDSQWKCDALDSQALRVTPDMSEEEKMRIQLMRGT